MYGGEDSNDASLMLIALAGCIDKTSSAGLSEAINSMFLWYRKAAACIVFLTDVPATIEDDDRRLSAFENSCWFTRGWTLQELLAPRAVLFCDAEWNVFGSLFRPGNPTPTKDWRFESMKDFGPTLDTHVARITGISIEYLAMHGNRNSRPLHQASIAERMSWAARRKTTRKEDEAYCLLGIFDINMPLLYGEREKAFSRLQEEIIKRSPDMSIFLWHPRYCNHSGPILARGPRDFHGRSKVPKLEHGNPFEVTNRGLRVQARAVNMSTEEFTDILKERGFMVPSHTSWLVSFCYVHFLELREGSDRSYGDPSSVLLLAEKRNGGLIQQYARLYLDYFGVSSLETFQLQKREIQPERTFYVDAFHTRDR
jgi:hypothetical protein